MALIRTENLCHVYSKGTPFEKTAIDNVSVSIPSGQMVAVIGHTGSGKSTFIQHLNSLLQPTSGKVYLDETDINSDKLVRKQSRFRVGMVFQYPEYQLFEETVYADIAFGPKNMKLSEQEIDENVKAAAAFTGIGEELFDKSPLELSGGQKRRIAIAGVIAMRPEVLILDEPTAGLDPSGCRQILDNIADFREKTGSTVIFVSHNMDDVARMAERILVFNKGTIAMDGSPDEIFSRADELVEMGLSVPAPTAIAMELKKCGMNIAGPVYTHAQLKAAIMECKGVGSC